MSEKNTHRPRYTCRCEWQRIKSSIHYITVLWCTMRKDFIIHVYLSNIPLKISVVSEWISASFKWWPRAELFSTNLPLRHDCSEQTEEWKLHFAWKCLTRKWRIKCEKMNQALGLAGFFKMQKLIGCGTTVRKCQLLTDFLPPPGRMHA